MPETRRHHVLDGAGFAVGKLDFDPLRTRTPFKFWHRGLSQTNPWGNRAGLLGLRLDRLPVPLRVAEMMMRLHKVVNREVVLAVIEPGAAPDDVRRSRLFGQLPGRNKLKAGNRLVVSPFPEIKFIPCCCGVL